tara:strand:+ start:541 stop:1869 length:1329 start_codon:yes stop_codon:yes gene_type:complete
MPITPNLQDALLGYISGRNADVGNSARAQAAATGFANNTPEYINAFRNAVIDHAMANGLAENRPGAEQLVNVVTNERNQGFNPVTGLSFDPNFHFDTVDGPVYPNRPPEDGGSDNASGGGMMSGPVGLEAGALNPVTSLIGTPGTGQTGPQATLMGQTAGLATGQQGIRDIVTPLGEQVTALDTKVTPLASDIGTVKTDVGGIKTDVGTVKAGVGDVQSAIGTPAEGQTLLGGQQGIMSGIGTAGTGQTDLFKGQADLTAGQTGIQSAIGTADPEIEQPATLFEGQAGLAANQSGLMSGQKGITRDLTTEIGDVSSALGNQLGAFRTAAENYQRGATTQRGDIQGTQRANQANMLSQIQGVGQPINRQAEALANQRQQEAASFAASQAPLQQQIATLTANNANQAANNQPIGPLGPMAADPRDALIQQLLTRNASLMNNRPV